MAILLALLCCRHAALLPFAVCIVSLSRKISVISGPGPCLTDSPAYALLQALFNPRLALPGLILVFLLVRASNGRAWLPFVALFGLSATQGVSWGLYGGPSSGLLNGLVLIHPPLLFFGYGCLAVCLLDLPSYSSRLLLGKRPNYLAIRALFTFLLALMLGAIWAQHELNWGGWWGWDLVELGSLFFLLLAWFLTHQPARAYSTISLARHGLSFFILFYLGLRFGFFESVHAFIGPMSRLPLHIPLFYALPLLAALRPVWINSKHLLGLGLLLSLGLIWIRAGVEPLGPNIRSFFPPSIGQTAALILSGGLSLYPQRARPWPTVVWAPFFINPLGLTWFTIYKPRGLHAAVAIATLGLPLLKFAPVQLAHFSFPAVEAVIASPSALSTFASASLQAYSPLIPSAPVSLKVDYFVQPGLHPALTTLLAPTGSWAHGAQFKNFLTLLSLQALNSFYIVPSFYLVFSLALAKKHHIQQK